MKKINLLGVIATIIVAISVFLPFTFVKSSGITKSLISGDGVIVLFACAVAAIGIIIKKNWVLIVGGIVSLFITVFDGIISVAILTKGNEGNIIGRHVGFYLMLIGSMLMIAAGCIKRR